MEKISLVFGITSKLALMLIDVSPDTVP